MATIETERGTVTIIQKGEKMDNFKEKAKEVGEKAWKITKKYAPYALAVGCFYIFCDAIYRIGSEDGIRKAGENLGLETLVDNERGENIHVLMTPENFAKIGTDRFQLLLKRFPDSAADANGVDILNF